MGLLHRVKYDERYKGVNSKCTKCTVGMKMASSEMEPWYISLLGLSETFRTSNPPNLKLCIHCLQSIFNFNPPPIIESRTHLQLGTILLYHTKNQDLARSHLEKAVSVKSIFMGCQLNEYETVLSSIIQNYQ